MLPFQFGCDVWKTLLELLEPVVTVSRITAGQSPFYLRFFHSEKHRDGDATGFRQIDVFVDCTLVQVQFSAYRPVRFSVKMETQRLRDLVHFFAFTCHGLLNYWLSCKGNKQVGGNAPKSEAATDLARAIFIRYLPILDGYAPKKSLDSGPCDWVVMLRITYASSCVPVPDICGASDVHPR